MTWWFPTRKKPCSLTSKRSLQIDTQSTVWKSSSWFAHDVWPGADTFVLFSVTLKLAALFCYKTCTELILDRFKVAQQELKCKMRLVSYNILLTFFPSSKRRCCVWMTKFAIILLPKALQKRTSSVYFISVEAKMHRAKFQSSSQLIWKTQCTYWSASSHWLTRCYTQKQLFGRISIFNISLSQIYNELNQHKQ